MAETIEVKVPDIGDFDGVDVIEVLVAEGDQVGAEDSLITLESDKATMEVPTPKAGTIRSLKVQVGDQVREGDVVATLELGEAEGSEAPAEPAAEPASDEQAAAAPAEKPAEEPAEPPAPEPPAEGRQAPPVPAEHDPSKVQNVPHASPAIRRFGRELGVDLSRVRGSGRAGRILRGDVTSYVKSALSGQSAGTPAGGGLGLNLPPLPKVDFSKFGEVEELALSRIQKISGPALARNWVSIPHVTQFEEADITEMEAFRKANKADAERQGIRLTPIAFLMKACVRALRKFPTFNASLAPDGESLILKKYFHIGVAVDTPNGLVVPVIRDCDKKGLLDLAAELGETAERARDGKLTPKDLQGGCFSISSLGGIGGTAFTPIINAPEVAILGASKSYMKPVWNGKEFEPRLTLPLSLSYDHRVIDGASAARFAAYLADLLADLRRVML